MLSSSAWTWMPSATRTCAWWWTRFTAPVAHYLARPAARPGRGGVRDQQRRGPDLRRPASRAHSALGRPLHCEGARAGLRRRLHQRWRRRPYRRGGRARQLREPAPYHHAARFAPGRGQGPARARRVHHHRIGHARAPVQAPGLGAHQHAGWLQVDLRRDGEGRCYAGRRRVRRHRHPHARHGARRPARWPCFWPRRWRSAA